MLENAKINEKEAGDGPFIKTFHVDKTKEESNRKNRCSGCGSVGRAVASDTRGPQFESSLRQTFIYILNICLLSTIEKTKIKKKRPGMAHFYKNIDARR